MSLSKPMNLEKSEREDLFFCLGEKKSTVHINAGAINFKLDQMA